MTDHELQALVAENCVAIRELRLGQAENARQWESLREELRATRQKPEENREKQWQQEALASRQNTDRLISRLNREFARLGKKLGGYTESLFHAPLERALREQFGMTVVYAPLRVHRLGENLEIDMVGHTVGKRNEAYLVEIKSQLRQDTIDQLLDHLRQFPRFCPEHRGKKLFGIVAALEIPSSLRNKVLKEGFYLATIKDDVFEIVPPDDFVPGPCGRRHDDL